MASKLPPYGSVYDTLYKIPAIRRLILDFSLKSVTEAYVALVTRVVPGPLSLSYFVPPTLLVTALLIPPESLSRRAAISFFLLPSYAATIHAWLTMGGVDVISVNAVVWSTYLLAFKDPKKDFRRLWRPNEAPSYLKSSPQTSSSNGSSRTQHECQPQSKSNAKQQVSVDLPRFVEEPYPSDFLARVHWVGTLLLSLRLEDWKIGEKAHDSRRDLAPEPPSRKQAVLALLPGIIGQTLFFPLLIQLARYDPGIHSLQPLRDSEPATVQFIRSLVPASIMSPLLLGFYSLSLVYGSFVFLVPVAILANYLLNIPPLQWSLHRLPPFFGSFAGVLDYGVSGIWGKWWHQLMRISVSAPGRTLASWLGLDPRKPLSGFATFALQVSSAFIVSGLVHMGMVPPLHPEAARLRLCMLGFFSVQIVAVISEALFVVAWRRTGLGWLSNSGNVLVKTALRVARLVWAVGWMCFSLRWLMAPFDLLGWWEGWWFMWPVPGLAMFLTRYSGGEWIP